ncbi:hypothetical protein KDD93_03770 [Campylobacter sp. faydin G-24]|uniref:Small hydrophobic protein n=1 Tax=Campylobacter anatolicus TaxID=2829105 RepID=A0ABS5HJA4_9BACT|nr:hypothetical protein [Campylobacter anatolicus]MBR8462191.1 hypothetical protein [Campylobacter anatolicus]MBR8463692.1 hypothetical protein [Campylobacter anatolicus]MBR8466396.1 hypothetical protein [Campylobacter anatolicus]
MSVLDSIMLTAFIIFIVFMIRGVVLQVQKKDEIRAKMREKREEMKKINKESEK